MKGTFKALSRAQASALLTSPGLILIEPGLSASADETSMLDDRHLIGARYSTKTTLNLTVEYSSDQLV